MTTRKPVKPKPPLERIRHFKTIHSLTGYESITLRNILDIVQPNELNNELMIVADYDTKEDVITLTLGVEIYETNPNYHLQMIEYEYNLQAYEDKLREFSAIETSKQKDLKLELEMAELRVKELKRLIVK